MGSPVSDSELILFFIWLCKCMVIFGLEWSTLLWSVWPVNNALLFLARSICGV